MLSSCSNRSLSHEMSVYSMWQEGIQMSYAVTAHRKRVTLMRSKTETLLQEDSEWNRSEGRFLSLGLSGMKLSYRDLERNFLRLARAWLQGHFAAPLPLSPATQTGDIDPSPCRTNTLVTFRCLQQIFQSSLLGYHTTWRDLNIPVSARLRRRNRSQLSFCRRSATASRALAPPRGRLDVYSADSCRKTTITSPVRADSTREDPVGPQSRQTRLFWRTLFTRRGRVRRRLCRFRRYAGRD